ncbi:MAG: PKD domain-containing protein [Bacteroidales bacterium]|nr:PKD domain-containing protein [Bacteroidales bacterium]
MGKLICHIITFIIFYAVSVQSIAQKHFSAQKLSFNNPMSDEYAPMFFQNDIVFVSNRKNDVLITHTDMSDRPLNNIYLVKQRKPGRFGPAQLFSRDISTRYNEGPVSFSNDGKTMYFSRNIDVSKSFGNSLRGDSTLGLFTAELVNENWVNIKPVQRFNRPNYNHSFPFITDDGKQLFFASDDPRGFGGYDIYVSELEGGAWGPAQNLGNKINTKENEVFPFCHAGGRLYFSSRGHDNNTDLDIFYSELIDGEWQEPVKMPAPFNSDNDDFSFIINSTMDTGFFASDRSQSRDIFMFSSTLPVFTNCPRQQENDYCYIFYEQGSIDLDTTSFRYEWDLGDGTRIRDLEANHCYKTPGLYLIKLNVIDTLTGEVYFSQAEYEHMVEEIEQPYITMPDTVSATEVVAFGAGKTHLLNFEIDNFYWDFGDGTRASGINVNHVFTKPGTYMVQLGVLSTTNNENQEPQQRCVTRPLVVIRD